MPPKLCIECGVRPKDLPRQRCVVCALRHAPIDDQVEASRRRLAMVPESMRVKRTKAVETAAPAGTSWCAGCQTFRDAEDFGKSATRCRACVSAVTHASRVEKVYGLTAEGYAELLATQGGKCAICRARPKSKRLAVDHDHKTGAVRGLLCSRCNHDLMGAAWDSSSMALALWHYIATPPASGSWRAPERGLAAPETQGEVFGRPSDSKPGGGRTASNPAEQGLSPALRDRWQVVGSGRDPERGRYLVYIDRADENAPAPF